MGEIQTQTISIENISGKAQGMVVAIISVPSCIVVDQAQLGLLRDSGSINNYEVSADNTLITLYWTYLELSESKSVVLNRVVMFGGSDGICLERASQAFLYYADDQDLWVK